MNDRAPTEDEIAAAYCRDSASLAVKNGVLVNEKVEQSEGEVRRGLARIKAEAWDEGHAAGMDEGQGATIVESNPHLEARHSLRWVPFLCTKGRRMNFLCRIGLHSWDYYGNEYTHAPRPIRCERCRKKYGERNG